MFPDQCYTVGGPNPGKPCVFPFKWNGKTYTGKFNVKSTFWCIFFSLFLVFPGCPIDADHKSKRWCSTKVDYNGNHVVKQNQYGHCSSSCPIDNSNSGSGGYGNNNNNNHHGNQSKKRIILSLGLWRTLITIHFFFRWMLYCWRPKSGQAL